MKAITHKITHQYQPDNHTCGYASLAMLLSFYGVDYAAQQLVEIIPQPKDEKGVPLGSVTGQLVEWCSNNNFKAEMYSFDFILLDASWSKLNQKEILEKLKKIQKTRVAPTLGKHWSRVYLDAYIGLMNAGAKLIVQPYVTSELLYKLLEKGPVYANICSSVSGGGGRKREVGLRKTVSDDINGHLGNHSIVIYGNDKDGNFLIADPWSGLMVFDRDKTIASITAAVREGDSQIFVIEKETS